MEKQRRTDTVRPCVEVEREEVTMYNLSRGEPDTTTEPPFESKIKKCVREGLKNSSSIDKWNRPLIFTH